MSTYIHETHFVVTTCCACGIQFAMTKEYRKARLDRRDTFYCPSGHPQHFTGPTSEDKLRSELERKDEQLQAANARTKRTEHNLSQVMRAHKKMRDRIVNGVCPCCNRSFQNLRAHMQTEHADFGKANTLKGLRLSFGMTQSAVASEAGVDVMHVSLYERDKPMAKYAKQALDDWLDQHSIKEPQP